MNSSTRQRLLMAAMAGLMGAGTQGSLKAQTQLKDGEVKCYGVNGCGAHAKCSVSASDIDAVKRFLGAKEFKAQFGKSQTHSCGAHAKCGASSKILNWVPATEDACKTQGGLLIDDAGGKKTARKP